MRFLTLYRREILITVFLAATYFVTRLFFILHLPIFTDEAIYIRWSQIAKQDAAWRFISLTDGKQPMFVWITMTLMKFVKDPLLAGRLTSVIAGFFSAIGLFFLGNALFKNKWVGFLSAAIYVLLPFTLVYDRMALYESLVCMFLIWGLYITILMTKRLQLYLPFIAGLIIGGGMLTKTTNFWSLYFMPFLLLLFDWRKEQRWQRFFRWVCFAVLVTALAYTYYSILRLSPYFGIIAEKNYTFYYPLNEWLHHPLVFFSGNLQGMISWLVTYINWLSILLIVFSFFVQRKLWKEKILLILWFVVPFLIFALIAKVLYPRYILYMTVFLIPLISLGVFESFRVWKQTVVGICIIVFLFASYLYVDRFILFDFAHAP
ncbi:MAG TPA: glycosyltransferase family 39 protein, partial [Patescibacteria group bacterium]|nr:glycosyltransferase family 39 protein [Patescibacteria group bacterium]